MHQTHMVAIYNKINLLDSLSSLQGEFIKHMYPLKTMKSITYRIEYISAW